VPLIDELENFGAAAHGSPLPAGESSNPGGVASRQFPRHAQRAV